MIIAGSAFLTPNGWPCSAGFAMIGRGEEGTAWTGAPFVTFAMETGTSRLGYSSHM